MADFVITGTLFLRHSLVWSLWSIFRAHCQWLHLGSDCSSAWWDTADFTAHQCFSNWQECTLTRCGFSSPFYWFCSLVNWGSLGGCLRFTHFPSLFQRYHFWGNRWSHWKCMHRLHQCPTKRTFGALSNGSGFKGICC